MYDPDATQKVVIKLAIVGVPALIVGAIFGPVAGLLAGILVAIL